MKVDRGRNKKPTSALPLACQELIEKLLNSNEEEVIGELKKVETWSYGKCELYHWISVLDKLDGMLGVATAYPKDTSEDQQKKILPLCQNLKDPEVKDRAMTIVRFTALLIEHSYARHVYNSVEHLLSMMNSSDMDVLLNVMNVLYVFGKRSNFLTRLYARLKTNLNNALEYLGKSWGGKEYGFGLAECLKYKDLEHFPETATSVVFEYSLTEDGNSDMLTAPARELKLMEVHKIPGTLEEIFTQLVHSYHIPRHQQLALLFKIRTARCFADYNLRLKCIEARLQAIAIANSLDHYLYPGLIEEIVEVLELTDPDLIAIKSAALRALTAIVHLDKNLRLNEIVESTGAYAYHGFLPTLVRDCVSTFNDTGLMKFPQPFATALFSFLYHLSSYQYSAEALVSSGVVELLLRVIECQATEPNSITFVTRAVRVLDLIINVDVSAFHSRSGWTKLLDRLSFEIEQCQRENPFMLPSEVKDARELVVTESGESSESMDTSTRGRPSSSSSTSRQLSREPVEEGEGRRDRAELPGVAQVVEGRTVIQPEEDTEEKGGGTSKDMEVSTQGEGSVPLAEVKGSSIGEDSSQKESENSFSSRATKSLKRESSTVLQCIPQRSALIKSILNFFRKIIPDSTFADDARLLHHSPLVTVLKHIFSNGGYYGATLYLAAIDIFTGIVYHEPVILSNLLEQGLAGVILNSFILKDIPQTSEVLCAVPNCISALCLNEEIRKLVMSTCPFDRLLKTLISPPYHLAMKKHNRGDRTTVPNTLGVCVDQLLRHQTDLRECFMMAVMRLLEKTIRLGAGPELSKEKAEKASRVMDSQMDDEEVEEVTGVFLGSGMGDVFGLEKEEELAAMNAPPPQVEYVVNVVMFLTSVLCHNRSSDHAVLFLEKGGIQKLYRLATLPNFPVDFPTTTSATTLSSIFGAIMNMTADVKVITEGLSQFVVLVDELKEHLVPFRGEDSCLFQGDLEATVKVINSNQKMLQNISHIHCFLVILNNLSRVMHTSRYLSQPVPRQLHSVQLQAWATPTGYDLLKKLANLYKDLIVVNFKLMTVVDVEKVKYPPPVEESSQVQEGVESKTEGVESKTEGVESKVEEGTESKTKVTDTTVEGETEPKVDDKPESISVGIEVGGTGESESEESKGTEPSAPPDRDSNQVDVGLPAGDTPVTDAGSDGSEPMDVAGKGKSDTDSKNDSSKDDSDNKKKGTSKRKDSTDSEDEEEKKKKPIPEEIKILKGANSFLALTSRISRALSELFNQLVLLVGEPPPKPRFRQLATTPPQYAETVELAKIIITLLMGFVREEFPVISRGMISASEDVSSPLFEHLAVGMYFLEFCELLLFDDNRSAYHILLKPFEDEGGIELLRDCYEHGLRSLEQGPLQGPVEGVVLDYFEMWLCMMEKIFCYDGSVRGAHEIPDMKDSLSEEEKGELANYEFNAIFFFIKCQKILGPCLVQMWKSPYLPHYKPKITDLLLSCIRLFVESDVLLQSGVRHWVKTQEEKAERAKVVTVPPTIQAPPEHVQKIMDMGFTRENVEEALKTCDNNQERATEWLVQKKQSEELSEDDQMSLAIALSIEQATAEKEEEKMDQSPQSRVPTLIDRSVIDSIGENIVDRWKLFVFSIPETVFRISSLMNAMCVRLGEQYKISLHRQLVQEVVFRECDRFLSHFEGMTPEEIYVKLREESFKEDMERFRIAMHLLAQYSKEQPIITATMAEMDAFRKMVEVLKALLPGIVKINRVENMHGWINFLLVSLDLCIKQLGNMEWGGSELLKPHWHWFDESAAKWIPYSDDINALLERGLIREDPNVKTQIGRQKITVTFSTMMQSNLDTGSCRPVMRLLTPPVPPKKLPQNVGRIPEDLELEVARCCTLLMSAAMDKDGMHANCRLLVRYTRSERGAQVFIDNEGIDKLFRVRRRSGFKNYYSMACHVVRHVFEMGQMRRFVFEKAFVKSVTNPYFANHKEVKPAENNAKEFVYVMRRLAGSSQRDYDLYMEMFDRLFTLASSLPSHESYGPQKTANPAFFKPVTGVEEPPDELTHPQKHILDVMTDTIVKRDLPRLGIEGDNPKDLAEEEQKVSRRVRIVSGWPPGSKEGEVTEEEGEKKEEKKEEKKDSDSESEDEYYRKRDKAQLEADIKSDIPEPWRKYELPVLTKAALTRLMMELVECYPPVAPYIVTVNKVVKLEKYEPEEEMTFLAFLLDYLLAGDMRISSFMGSKLPKRLLESIITVEYFNHTVQEGFVGEFKGSLVRTFQMPECLMKHNRLRSLCSLLNYFMENHSSKPLHTITRHLIHKGVISDFAKASYMLDLDNGSFTQTMNAILRPLDRLIRYVNHVNAHARQQRKLKLTGAPVSVLHDGVTEPGQVQMGHPHIGEQPSRPVTVLRSSVAPVTSRESRDPASLSTSVPQSLTSDGSLQPTSSEVPEQQASQTTQEESQEEVVEEPLVPLEVHDDELDLPGDTEGDILPSIVEELLDDLVQGEMETDSEGDEMESDLSEESIDDCNSAGEEKRESDYEDGQGQEGQGEGSSQERHLHEVMISFRDDTSSDPLDPPTHQVGMGVPDDEIMHGDSDFPYDDDEDHSVVDIDVGEEGDVESVDEDDFDEEHIVDDDDADSEGEGGESDVGDMDEQGGRQQSDEDDAESHSIDIEEERSMDDEEDEYDSSLLDSEVEEGEWPRGGRTGSNSSSSSAASRTPRHHQPEETGPIPVVHPLTIRRIVQVYSMATGRLVNQRSEYHADGADHIRYRRIALQAGIMRPTFNPTTSVTQVMAGGERVDNNKDNGTPSSLLLMEDYEIGPIHCVMQRWDEEAAALNGPSHFVRMSKEMWDVGDRLSVQYEEEKKKEEKEDAHSVVEEQMETSPHKSTSDGMSGYSSLTGLVMERQRNPEEVSSVATRGSSPSQSVITMETEVASERSVSPAHTAVSGTASEHRLQGPSREGTPVSHDIRDDSRVRDPPVDPVPPHPTSQEVIPSSQSTSQHIHSTPGAGEVHAFDGSVESARTILSSLNRDDHLYPFYMALVSATPPPPSGPVLLSGPTHPVGVSSSRAEDVTSTSSPSDTLGPLLTSSLAVSSSSQPTTVSSSTPHTSVILGAIGAGGGGGMEVDRLSSTPESTQLSSQPSPLSQDVTEQQSSSHQQRAEQQPPSDQQGAEQQPSSDQQGVEQQQSSDQQGVEQQPPSDQEGVRQQLPSDQQGAGQGPSSTNQALPEVLDPTFLAALPDTIRSEVVAQHQAQRQRHRATRQPSEESPESSGLQGRIDPSVLAQLPPEIQAEVRQQQASTDPSTSQDTSSFFSSLPPHLRRTVIRDLADQENSDVSQLPEEIVSEIRQIRQDLERHRQIMEQLTTSTASSFPLTSGAQRLAAIFTFRDSTTKVAPSRPLKEPTAKQILDPEALSCLLVLLFLEPNKLHVNRLHRVLRHVSVHPDTRAWILASVFSIIHQCEVSKQIPVPTLHKVDLEAKTSHHHDNWLNLTVAGALGSHTPVFFVDRSLKGASRINIHPHACPGICKNALELLTVMGKHYPSSFLPPKLVPPPKDSNAAPPLTTHQVSSNFWQLLSRLNDGTSRKGKGSAKMSTLVGREPSKIEEMFSVSFLAQLVKLLENSIVVKNPLLIDKLLRTLVVVSNSIPKSGLSLQTENTTETKTEDQKSESHSQEGELKVEQTEQGVLTSTKDEAMETSSSDDVFKKEEESMVEPHLLQFVMKLLLSSSNLSDTAEEDATKLLVNLSQCSQSTRQAVLQQLVDGAQGVGRKVLQQIEDLLDQLVTNMDTLKMSRASSISEGDPGSSSASPKPSSGGQTGSSHPALRGIVLPQADSSKRKVGYAHDLHLPGMVPLTCKGSQQGLFLRILKVIHDLREAAVTAAKSQLRKKGSAAKDVVVGHLLPRMSIQLELEELWDKLSQCLDALADTDDPHAVLVLQPAVESFFIVHAVTHEHQGNVGHVSASPLPLQSLSDDFAIPSSPLVGSPRNPPLSSQEAKNLPPDLVKFLSFAENHRTVLNNILRQMGTPLGESPFAILVEHTKLLDFDVKKRYFRQELDALKESSRRDDVVVHVRRENVFEDSFRELYHRQPSELHGNLYISFEGEEGQDAGGVQREWYLIISREIFNPNYALFKTVLGGRTYVPNPSSDVHSDHLQYFRFVGRVIGKAIYENKLLDCYFTRSFYKHMLGKHLHFSDMESEDYAFYQSMKFILENNLDASGLDLTFSTEVSEFGKTTQRDLKADGHTIPVTEANKKEYVKLMCHMKMTELIRPQLKSFLEGLYEVIPKRLISIFNEQELELLISGLPMIDLDDLKTNTEYHKYSPGDLQIQWFWRALKSFDETNRAQFLQFVTGTSKVPLQGFAALEGMSGPQKFQIHRDDRSTTRLPSAHTCFNQLDLPAYETYEKLRKMLLLAVSECPEGFGFI